MRTEFFAPWRSVATALALALTAPVTGSAEPAHGIAMYGDPALPPDFVSLPYANPDAPTGGRIIQGEIGGFDSLNPHIRRGRVPWQLRFLAYESLMGRSYGEPFALYGLLAESVEVDPGHMWVEFQLRPEARFSDGSPLTVEDVIWSYETLGTIGHPRYLNAWQKIDSIAPAGERGVRLTFTEPDRELALIMGLRPILKAGQWAESDFAESGLDTIPISTAPYVIDDFEANRFVSLRRDPDYWGRNLPLRRGTNNIDEIRMEFYADAAAMFEAFKAGELTTMRETNIQKWDTQYDFPATRDGRVVKSLIPHQRPTGITGLVMNTRSPVFADWRVREAMLHAFNFEFINLTLNGDPQPRISSYFSNSVLGMEPGPAEGRVREFLEPFAGDLLPGALDGYTLPEGDGSERNRRNIAQAMALMEEAGWTIQEGEMRDASGAPFTFEIVLSQGATETQQIVDLFASALNRLGITPRITTVDSAQYQERTTAFDFDMAYYIRGLSLSPGNEQMLYWSSEAADTEGSRNWMGMRSDAAEAMIDRMLTSASQEDYVAAVRALDRVLTTGRYVIPIWHSPVSRLAHSANLRYPDTLPIYGDWIGFQPDVWWYEE